MAEPVNSIPTAQGQSYMSLVHQLSSRYPTLRYLTSFINEQRSSSPNHHPVGCSVLEFHEDGVNYIEFNSCSDPSQTGYTKLAKYLSSNPPIPAGRLYMLEDLSEPYIELLGSYLGVDAQVFAAQIHDTHWSGKNTLGHPPQLPSLNDPEKAFTLKYYEPRFFEYPDTEIPSTTMKTVANVSRNITYLKALSRGNQKGSFNSQVCSIRRNASFWCRHEEGGGWNGLLLLDPPIVSNHLTFLLNNKKIVKRIKANSAYQGGYRDFAPWPDKASFPLSETVIRGPLRVSLAQDIAYYWGHIASGQQIRSALNNPYESTIFLRRIIASIWNSTSEHQHAVMSQLETKLWAMQRMIDPDLTDAKKKEYLGDFTAVLNNINTIKRRTNWYSNEMKINLEILGVNPENFPRPSHHREDQDFVAIHNKLLTQQTWAEKLLDIISTHLTLMETEKSMSDSKSLSRLTILGFFFVPVSFVCSFFSMNGRFAVGEDRFWIYFAVTVPLTIAILVMAFGNWWYTRFQGINLFDHNPLRKRIDGTDEEKKEISPKM